MLTIFILAQIAGFIIGLIGFCGGFETKEYEEDFSQYFH